MDDADRVAVPFEAHRAHLRAVAYRMLGSHAEADDAVQETWLRLARTDTSDVENLGGWLTTVVARICLNVLRSRGTRREDALDDARLPDLVIEPVGETNPEHEAMLGDAVGLALLVVLDTLPPAERLALVLHDMFGVPFEDIAAIVDRSPAATRQLASRARRRVRDTGTSSASASSADGPGQRRLVDAFFAAARGGDFEGLIAVLDPDIALRVDFGPSVAAAHVRGAADVAARAVMFADPSRRLVDVVVNGGPGVLVLHDDHLVNVMAFTVADGRIVAIQNLADPERLAALELPDLGLPGQ